MIRRCLIYAAIAVAWGDAPSASAQVHFQQSSFFSYSYQRGHYSFGGGYCYAAPVYGYVYFYSLPPVVILPPPVDFRNREPRRDARPTVDEFSQARVDAAVKRGDFRVIKPGERIVPPAPAIPLPKPPKDPQELAEFLVKQARDAFERNQIGRAGEQLRAALEIQPKVAPWHFWLAQIHIARGEYSEAVGALRAGMALEPAWPKSPFNLAELYGTRRDALATDLAELKAILASNPGDAGLQFLTGCCEWFSGNRQAASKLIDQAKRLYPVECGRFRDAAKD